MGEDAPAVDDGGVLEEVGPEAAPVKVVLNPQVGLVKGLEAREFEGKRVQLDARLQPRPRGRVAPHLRERVEDAPLHPRRRPNLAHGLGKTAAAIRDDYVGRRY